MKKDIILVTGGAGFLGQHVVKLLQTTADHVLEIRVLDEQPFVKKLSYDAQKPVHQYVGSITDPDIVHRACRGVNCVIHLASYIDYTMFPDETKSNNVNVEGTRNVIAACQAEGVQRLIYGSSIEAVKSSRHEIFDGTEDNTKAPLLGDFLFKVYGPTKKQAEDLVCQANCSTLKTMVLRILPMYGELEARIAPTLSNSVRATGFYFAVNCGKSRTSHCYVGNTAWGFLCADRALQTGGCPAGKVLYIGDDTPPASVYETLKPFAEEAGYKQFPVKIPLWLLLYPIYLIFLILSVICYVWKVNIPVGIAAVYGMDKSYIFRYDTARKYVNYKPRFSYTEAKQATAAYYKGLLTR